MSIANDDPRLTAYALGEMAAEERNAFEKELERPENAGARAEAEAIRAFGARLAGEFAAEAAGPGLSPEKQEAVSQAAAAPVVAPLPARRTTPVFRFAAMAAACVALVFAGRLFFGERCNKHGSCYFPPLPVSFEIW